MRTTVNLDPAVLDAARHALGTDGVSETVNAALAEVVRRVAIQRFDVRAFDVTDDDIRRSRQDRLGPERS
jgi:Arc/MetJ family transcription regulator